MLYEPDVKEVSAVANAIAWVMFAEGQPETNISDAQLDLALGAADNALRVLDAFRKHTEAHPA